MPQDSASTLVAFPLFEGLTAESLKSIAALLERRSFRKGTTLLMLEERSRNVFIIESGLVRVCDGRCIKDEVLLALLGPGEIIGEIHALDSMGHSADVIAAADTVCWCMSNEDFTRCLHEIPQLCFNLLRLTAKRLRNTTDKISLLATQDVMGRVARQLLILSDQAGVLQSDGSIAIDLPLTQTDLASLTGASRQRINTVLTSFREQEAITCSSSQFIIRDPELLRRRCR
ncbi:MAG TPA: Crp/Fnr family transcriptional regulator [Abditibacteriaceae bacterium]|jgi:CRP/FNR family transcriptional regulator